MIMESTNSLSNMRSSLCTAGQTMLPSIGSHSHGFPSFYANSCNINIKNVCSNNNEVVVSSAAPQNHVEGLGLPSYHQRHSSESFHLPHHQVEQPSWLEDLLDEPDQSALLNDKSHRRSSSDSAYLCLLANKTTTSSKNQENNLKTSVNNNAGVPCWGSPNVLHSNINDPWKTASADSYESTSFEESVGWSPSARRKIDEDNVALSQNELVSAESNEAAQTKSSLSKAETKRAKQQSAHRSRVRKLQYIAELERNVQVLQVEGTQVSAQLDFLEQQNLILTMENRALRQRLESLSQEHMIKQLEQDMLEREIGRLQALHQLQLQQHQQHSKHRRNKSRDHFDAQFANLSLKN